MSRRISVRAIVLHENKLLCVRLKPYNGVSATMAGAWCVPGGGLDEGEALIPGLKREILEEIGIKAVVGNLMYIQQFAYNGVEFLEFFFHVTNAKDYLQVDLSKTTHGATEIAEINFVDPVTTNILPKFLTTEPLVKKAANPLAATIFSFLES